MNATWSHTPWTQVLAKNDSLVNWNKQPHVFHLFNWDNRSSSFTGWLCGLHELNWTLKHENSAWPGLCVQYVSAGIHREWAVLVGLTAFNLFSKARLRLGPCHLAQRDKHVSEDCRSLAACVSVSFVIGTHPFSFS